MEENAPSPGVPPAPSRGWLHRELCPRRLDACLLAALVFLLLWASSDRPLRIRPDVENKVMARTVAAAVSQYMEEHSGPPSAPEPPAGPGGAEPPGDRDTSPESGLTALLLGKQPGTYQDYLDGFKTARRSPNSPGVWRGGLVYEDGCYSLCDACGGFFRVRMDLRNEGSVTDPDPARGGARLPGRAAAWTAGKDRNWNTWEDNETSWK